VNYMPLSRRPPISRLPTCRFAACRAARDVATRFPRCRRASACQHAQRRCCQVLLPRRRQACRRRDAAKASRRRSRADICCRRCHFSALRAPRNASSFTSMPVKRYAPKSAAHRSPALMPRLSHASSQPERRLKRRAARLQRSRFVAAAGAERAEWMPHIRGAAFTFIPPVMRSQCARHTEGGVQPPMLMALRCAGAGGFVAVDAALRSV